MRFVDIMLSSARGKKGYKNLLIAPYVIATDISTMSFREEMEDLFE